MLRRPVPGVDAAVEVLVLTLKMCTKPSAPAGSSPATMASISQASRREPPIIAVQPAGHTPTVGWTVMAPFTSVRPEPLGERLSVRASVLLLYT